MPVIFIDTAGLREARDEIESEGIRRSRQSLQQAEFILHVFDISEPLAEADETYVAEFAEKKRILVLNKIDLPATADLHACDKLAATAALLKSPSPPNYDLAPRVRVSCLTGEGIEALKDAIKDLVWSGQIKAEMLEVMINSRHQDALNRARTATSRTIDALTSGLTLELAALDLRIAVNAIGEIVGQTTTEDLLDRIFSKFCIGK